MIMEHRAQLRALALSSILLACGDGTDSGDDAAVEDAGSPGTKADSGAKSDAAEASDAEIGEDAGPPLTGSADRGQYLVDHVLVCGVCHTPSLPDGSQDMSKYLAGSRSYDFTDVDGTIVTVNAENLTSHDPEGLHSWTNAQIRRALTEGIDDEMIAIYPIMPYPEYSLLTTEDVDSIIGYLRSVAPNDNVVPADYPYFDQNPPVPPVADDKLPHTTLAATDPDYAAAERGRYLAVTACMNCHTEELSHGVPDLSKAFGGGKKYTFIRGAAENTSTNLTPDPTGLGDYSVDDIVATLKANTKKGASDQLCNTHPGGADRIGGMKDADLRDIATYLHTLPPVKNGPFTCVP